MHDIRLIRNNPQLFDEAMARRGLQPVSARILELDKARKSSINQLQELSEKANKAAKMIGQLMAQGKKDEAQLYMNESKELKAKIQQLKKEQEEEKNNDNSNADIQDSELDFENDELAMLLSSLPNILDYDVIDGKDEADNIELRKFSEPRQLSFTPQAHYDIAEKLNIINFDQAVRISGSRFATILGDLAKLERGLIQLMLDTASNEYGYLEVKPPVLVNSKALYGTSQLPKFEEDLFKTTDGRYLIPTAEVSLTNLVQGQILRQEQLPLRFTAYTECFRSEAGSAGRDTRGIIRQHQFGKIELVSITEPSKSNDEHERLTECAENILQKLDLPYRVMLLCTGDTGFGSRRTYDIEVHLPSQGKYREISSCSNFGDFQARRMQARYRDENDKINFVHTLNGSSLALGRTLVAIIENYQNADGTITIPEILRGFMGKDKIEINEILSGI